MIETYILKIDKYIGELDFQRLVSLVSKEKKEKIYRYYRFEDAQRSLLGDVLARSSICNRLCIKNKDLTLGTNEYGKPIVLKPNKIHFNISHSENWVVCAIDDTDVGIDVENISPVDFNIAERFFSRDEYLYIINQPEEMKLKHFYMIWTLKESYIKMQGKGLSIPLNSFSVCIQNDDRNAIIKNEISEYHFFQTFLENNIVYATCTKSCNISKITYLNTEGLIKRAEYII